MLNVLYEIYDARTVHVYIAKSDEEFISMRCKAKSHLRSTKYIFLSTLSPNKAFNTEPSHSYLANFLKPYPEKLDHFVFFFINK